ncbi:hypothetical protein H0B56_09145 [Haloechinothrix sp. YIM 98757]|uniref:Uncharacterized protein n=1 Tax=Haloechinothrix aidingensis TaxID=2752311 RepID=A0A838A366_9PSEU|nr:hypothetical protein [Haloechinothrix aidingensis]MBA0125703.1 hypothetical protein [Haloechinothrix aidingensis]
MDTRQVLVGAAALLLALGAGCGQDSSAANGEGNDAPASTPTESVSPDPGSDSDVQHGDPVPPEQIDDSALPAEYPREVSTTEGGRRLVVTAMESNGCVTAEARNAAETEQDVTVVLVHHTPGGDVMCTQQVTYPKVAVQLDGTLEDRTVVLKTEDRQG